MTEQEQFIARFGKMKAEGLVDIKFFVEDGSALSQDEFFAAANRIDAAVAAGKCVRRKEWDQDMIPGPFPDLAK